MKILLVICILLLLFSSCFALYTRDDFKPIYEKAVKIYPQLTEEELWSMYLEAQNSMNYTRGILTGNAETGPIKMLVEIKRDTILLGGENITNDASTVVNVQGNNNNVAVNSPNTNQKTSFFEIDNLSLLNIELISLSVFGSIALIGSLVARRKIKKKKAKQKKHP